MARTQVIKKCLSCGAEFSRRLGNSPGRQPNYCSQHCYREHHKPAREDPAVLFWSHVDKNGPGECWLWLGATRGQVKKYGSFKFGRKNEGAHRVAWMLLRGPIPDDKQVLHRCDVRLCVNAESHLWLGSHDDNMADKMRKGRGGHLRGSAHPNALFEEWEIVAIRASTQSISALSREYHVSRITIARIRNRKAWGHVGAPLPEN